MIYLDNAATTKPYDELVELINKYNNVEFFNPSALYKQAADVQRALKEARAGIAELIGAEPNEIYFTSGATESNNTVIQNAHKIKKAYIVTSEGEHPSVYNAVMREQSRGALVKFLPLKGDGTADLSLLDNKMDISLISLIHVSNETGAINDISAIAKDIKAKNKNALIHSDGVQALGKMPINVKALGVDLYSISGHKVNAPKGVGVLFIRNGVKIAPFIVGGGQENAMRSGTENISACIAFWHALKRKLNDFNIDKVNAIRTIFINELSKLSGITINCQKSAVPHILSVSIEGIRAEVLLHSLSEIGILIGNGSACSSKHSDNRILNSMGISEKLIKGSIRLSFNEYLCDNDAHFAATNIVNKVNELRRISQ